MAEAIQHIDDYGDPPNDPPSDYEDLRQGQQNRQDVTYMSAKHRGCQITTKSCTTMTASHNAVNHLQEFNRARPKLEDVLNVIFELN
jgi:hypothetical protein